MKKNGYLNSVVKDKDNYIRTPHKKFSNWSNELLVYQKLGIDVKSFENGVIHRKWIKGHCVHFWTQRKLNLLKLEIEKLHALSPDGLTKHNWHLYNDYSNHININDFNKFKTLINKYKNDKLVVSHNDINDHNVIYGGRKIHLIDFEWANLNSEYFDYVSFYISTGYKINESLDENIFRDYLFMTLIYFILWTFAAPDCKIVAKWRRQYQNLFEKNFSHHKI